MVYLVGLMKNSDDDTRNVNEEHHNNIKSGVKRSIIKILIKGGPVELIVTFFIKVITFNMTNTINADVVIHLRQIGNKSSHKYLCEICSPTFKEKIRLKYKPRLIAVCVIASSNTWWYSVYLIITHF